MTFVDQVRAVVRRGASRKAPWPPIEDLVDLVDLRRLLHELLDTAVPAKRDVAQRWSGDALDLFVEWLVPQLLSLELATEKEDVMRLLRAALQLFALERALPTLTPSWGAELALIYSTYPEAFRQAWQVPILYAERLSLVRSGVSLPAGQMLLSLPDSGVRRWLLALEVHQSLGYDDPWRVNRGHVETLIQVPEAVEDADDRLFWPHRRLAALGFVTIYDDDLRAAYRVDPRALADLKAVLDEDSAMSAVAKAITPDPGAVPVLPDLRELQSLAVREAGRAAAELGRTTAHELGNVVLPLEGALEHLSRVIGGTSLELDAAPFLSDLQKGVERLWRYKDWFKQLGDGLERPPMRFGARAAIVEAVQMANGGAIEQTLDIDAEVSLFGYRDRLVLALVNLLRNARQQGATTVRVAGRTEQQQLFIEIDDNGPGVPTGKEAMIFVSPFTTREEGSGQGLPLAKEIIETEHRGGIGYTRSPLGGARFTVRLPI